MISKNKPKFFHTKSISWFHCFCQLDVGQKLWRIPLNLSLLRTKKAFKYLLKFCKLIDQKFETDFLFRFFISKLLYCQKKKLPLLRFMFGCVCVWCVQVSKSEYQQKPTKVYIWISRALRFFFQKYVALPFDMKSRMKSDWIVHIWLIVGLFSACNNHFPLTPISWQFFYFKEMMVAKANE